MDKKYLIYLKREGYAEPEPTEIIKEIVPEIMKIEVKNGWNKEFLEEINEEKIPQFHPNFKTGKIDVDYIEYKPTEIEQERIKILKAEIAELEGKE